MKPPFRKSVANLAVVLAFAGLVSACDRNDQNAADSGAAERAGERVDNALSRAGDQLNKVAERTGKNLEQFGRHLQSEAREAQQSRSTGESGTEGEGASGRPGDE